MNLSKLRKKANNLLAEYKHAERREREETQALSAVIQCTENCSKAQVIVQELAEKVQQQAHKQIAAVVTRCLRAVFDDPYQFKIDFERKRGKTEARLTFVRKDYKIDPINGAGGGVVDVAAFALQIACILLQKPRRRRIFVADEPFKHLSKRYRSRIASMVEELAQELDFQFILVTHSDELQIGKVVKVK